MTAVMPLTLPHKCLREKLLMFGLDVQTVGLKNWPNVWAQRVVVGGTRCHWKLVIRRATTQGTVLGSVFFNIFISDGDEWTESTPKQVC